jgi:hypothetical protein
VSTIVDIKQALFAAIAIAVLSVAIVFPAQTLAASDCGSAGSDPTAAQYCPEEPPEEPTPEPPAPESEEASSPPPPEITVAPESSESSNEVAGVSEESGSLPFTGADLLVLAAVACAFICIGLALQRLSAAKSGSR